MLMVIGIVIVMCSTLVLILCRGACRFVWIVFDCHSRIITSKSLVIFDVTHIRIKWLRNPLVK